MRKRVLRACFLIAYVVLAILVVVLAILYARDSSTPYTEEFIDVNKGWFIDGELTNLPCTARGKVTLEKRLPAVRDDHVLVVQCYYMDADIYVGDKHIFYARPNTFMGHTTNVGNNEIKIPLSEEDSYEDVKIVMNVQNSVYTRRISDAFIYSKAGYVNYIILKNLFALGLATSLTTTGIFEILISIFYILRHTKIRARYSFLTLFYTGLFSVVTAVWVLCESRVLGAIFGHNTAFAIINDVFFMFMPLLFLEILRTMTNRDNIGDSVVFYIFAFSSFISVVLCLIGMADWNLTEYFGQLMVFIAFFHAFYASVRSLRRESNIMFRNAMIVGNIIFVSFSTMSLIIYMFGISENYLAIVIAGLTCFAMCEVVLVLQKIGISIEEEEALARVTKYAYNDDLTGLNNRRFFYSKLEELTSGGTPEDLTLISIDANRLKYYNDSYGHDAGDELLITVANSITEAFSGYDNAVICRMGGDEFAVALTGDKFMVDRSIEGLKRKLASYSGEVVSQISIALGYVQAGDHPGMDIDRLYKLADDKMYEDKKAFYDKTGVDRRKG